MSAVIKCKTRLKNQGDLVTALKKIGVAENFIKIAEPGKTVTHKGYSGATEEAHVTVDKTWHGGYGGISWRKEDDGLFVQIADDLDEAKWDRKAGGPFTQLLTQYYAAAAAERALRVQGFITKVEREGDRVFVRANTY